MTILIQPARCTSDVPDNLDDANLVSEEKLDGSRYVLYLGKNTDPYGRRKGNVLLSRRLSSIDNKHVDKTDNIPHVTAIDYPGLEGTILDGEVFLRDFPTTQGIMGSGAALAIQKQKAEGRIKYIVFDCPVFRGVDIRGKPLRDRRKVLLEVLRRMDNPHVVAIEQRAHDHAEHFHSIVGNGGEGVIIKRLDCGYGVAWSKMKKVYEVSAFVTGFKPGNGKYATSIGSIAISVHSGDKIVEVGFASGFDDDTRNAIGADPEAYLGRVVDIFAQEISKDGRLRHPTFYRWRDDLIDDDCTMEKLRDDLAHKVKSNRWKKEA